ncbi:MAG: hypothetical protein V4471_02025 [Pseudomonadota bacterium]
MIRKAENNNATNLSEKTNLEAPQFFPINTVQIGSCLFWSTALAYLVDLKQDKQILNEEENDLKFHLACIALFGQISAADEKRLKKLVDQFYVTHDLTFIYRSGFVQDLIFLFRQRVVDYIDQHRDLFKNAITDFDNYLASMCLATKFAGKCEIEAMVLLLNCSIEVIDIKTHSRVVHPFDNEENFCESGFLIQSRRLCLFIEPEKQCYYFGLKQIKKTTQSDYFSNKPSLESDIELNNLEKIQPLLFPIDVPGDNSCLFWAAALAYLISMEEGQFEEACRTLFGSCFSTDLEEKIFFSVHLEDIKEEITNFNLHSVQNLENNHIFVNLIRVNFRRQVVNYMSLHNDEFDIEAYDIDDYLQQMLSPDTWGGLQEVKAISSVLGCEIHLFPSWDQSMEEPLKIGSGLPVLYLFYDENHYYFGILKTSIKNYLAQASNDLHNEEIETDLSTSSSNATKKSKKIKISKPNTRAVLESEEVLKPSLFNDLIEGLSVGLFWELSLRLLTSIPLVKFLVCEKSDALKNDLQFSALIASPYSYYQNYQEFLVKGTVFDTFLNYFLDKDRLFTSAILFGIPAGLIKNLFNSENKAEFLIMMSIFFSILPLDYFGDKAIEGAQLLFRSALMLTFSLNGLVNTVDFSVTCVKKIANGASSAVEKMSKKIPVTFFSLKTEKKVTDSEASLQCGTRASL